MKTSNKTIKLLEKSQGYANFVDTTGKYESCTVGKFEWGIFHNGVGVRWFAIHKMNKETWTHVYDNTKELTEYINSNIMIN